MATPDQRRSGFVRGFEGLLSQSKLSWFIAGIIVAITGLAIGVLFGVGYLTIAILPAALIFAISQFAGGSAPK